MPTSGRPAARRRTDPAGLADFRLVTGHCHDAGLSVLAELLAEGRLTQDEYDTVAAGIAPDQTYPHPDLFVALRAAGGDAAVSRALDLGITANDDRMRTERRRLPLRVRLAVDLRRTLTDLRLGARLGRGRA